jgi:threonine aldolase
MIDLRSDTVTRPTAAMRKAMAEAEVGDDVYGDDPTVNRLEALGAELTGKEAALFVPSGTFGNQLALFTWCSRGSEVILGEECHIIQHEAGAASIIAGVQTRPVPAPEGVLSAELLRERLRRRDLHAPATSLICLENAHSLGRAVPLSAMDAVRGIAREWGLPVHLDGARIFNAAAALSAGEGGATGGGGASPGLYRMVKEIAARADSVMFCLSKGLCAPVGSLLAGKASFIAEARMKRKIMGGGMRQAGILAAAGICALREQPGHLAEDHRRARRLALGLSAIPGVIVDPGAVDINMVFFRCPSAAEQGRGEEIAGFFKKQGVLISPPGEGLFRFVTHYWIGDSDIERVLALCGEAFGGAHG